MAEQHDGSYRVCLHMGLITSIQISLVKASDLAKPVSMGQGNRITLQGEEEK